MRIIGKKQAERARRRGESSLTARRRKNGYRAQRRNPSPVPPLFAFRVVFTLTALLCLAMVFLAAAVVAWPDMQARQFGAWAIAAIALVYAVAGGSLMAWLLARVRSTPPLLQATLMELKQDCDALRGAARPPQ